MNEENKSNEYSLGCSEVIQSIIVNYDKQMKDKKKTNCMSP